MTQKTAIYLLIGLGLAVFLAIWSPFGEASKSVDAKAEAATPKQPTADKRRPNHRRTATTNEPAWVRIARVLEENRQLSDTQLAAYLKSNRTNALSLVTAFEATHDRDYLRMAAEAFPNDPLVQTKALLHNVLPERRAEMIAALKASDPKNSLPHLLTAQDLMKAGNVNEALTEITAASKKQFNDYTRESLVGLEEAYLASGYSVIDATVLGSSSLLLPHLAPMKQLASQAADMAINYRDSGDTDSQKVLLEACWAIGTQLKDSTSNGTTLNFLVGMAAQNMAVSRWPETEPAGFLDGVSAADWSAANQTQRKEIRHSAQLLQTWLPTASESEIITYFNRVSRLGEMNAMQWLREQNPDFAAPEAP